MKVIPDSKDFRPLAEKLANRFHFDVASDIPDALHLYIDERGLWLRQNGKPPMQTQVDFVTGALFHRRRFGADRNIGLGKAVGADRRRDMVVLDATAGLGRDAFVLAVLGNQVTMVEREPALVALLQDGISRARKSAQESKDDGLIGVLDRLTLISDDTVSMLQNHDGRFDVIYLDPMFPERKKSASVKKEMQLLQRLHGDSAGLANEMERQSKLLDISLQYARYRVVVKRPKAAPNLGFSDSPQPTFSIAGKSSRYDIYTLESIDS